VSTAFVIDVTASDALINGSGTLSAGTVGTPLIATLIRIAGSNLSLTINQNVTVNYIGSSSASFGILIQPTTSGSSTFVNKGTLNLSGTIINPIQLIGNSLTAKFDNQGTIKGTGAPASASSGLITFQQATCTMTNSGTINFNPTTDGTVIRAFSNTANGSFSNSGTITVGSGTTLTNAIILGDSKTSLTNTGTISIGSGNITGTTGTGNATFDNNANGVLNLSNTTASATLVGNTAIALNNNGGTITTGSTANTVTINTGTPGATFTSGAFSPGGNAANGKISLTNSVTLAGTTNINVTGNTTAGTDYDQIISSTASAVITLSGTLALTMSVSAPAIGTSIDIIKSSGTSGTITGTFSSVTGLSPGWALVYSANAVSLKYNANINFTGASGGNWNVPSNWDLGHVPGSTENVTVLGKTVVIQAGDVITINRLILNSSGTAASILNITGGILSINQIVGTASNPACLLQGGVINNTAGTVSITNAIASGTGAGLSLGNSAGAFKEASSFNNSGTLTIDVSAGATTATCISLSQTDAGLQATFTTGGTINLIPNNVSTAFVIDCGASDALITGSGTLSVGSIGTPLIAIFMRIAGSNKILTIDQSVTMNYIGSSSAGYGILIQPQTSGSCKFVNKGKLNFSGTIPNPIHLVGNNLTAILDNQGTISATGAPVANAGNNPSLIVFQQATCTMTNSGTINFNPTTDASVLRAFSTGASGSFSNSGTITVGSGTALTNAIILGDSKTSLTNTGTISIGSGSINGKTGGTDNAAFSNSTNGVLNLNNTTTSAMLVGNTAIAFTNNGGTITTGSTANTVTINTGTPGATFTSGVFSPGGIAANGKVTLTNSVTLAGTTNINVTGISTAGTDYDQIISSTTSAVITVSGALAVTMSALTPADGTTIDIIKSSGTSGTISGTFATITGLATGWSVVYTSNSVQLKFSKTTPIVTVNVGTYTYNGSAQGPNSVTTASPGTVTYSYSGTAYNPTSTRPTNAGTYTVTATVNSDSYYNSASSGAVSFSIATASQTISFGALPTGKTIGEADFAAGATSATSGVNAISYSTSDATVASISGIGQIHIVGVGTCTIYADQASSTNYNAATQASQSLTIAARPVITLGSNATSADLTNPVADISVPSNADLTIGADRTVHNITIERGGKVILIDGYSLTVNNINLNSDASGTGTFVDKNTTIAHGLTVNGTSTVQQYVSSTAKGVTGRNWYISSPVTTALSSTITSATTNDLVSYIESNGTWTNAGTTMDVMKGYIAVSPAQNTTLVFNGGTLNTGAQSVSNLSYTGATKKGFNLIGNPYPSYLDWDGATLSNVLKSVWYRSKRTGVYLFQTYNTDGGVETATNGATNLIPPMQAFWVRATSATNSVSFDNSMRSHQDQTVATNRLKSPSKTNAVQQVLRLAVSNGVNTDETVLYSNPNALNGADNYDSPKMTNANIAIPELFTLVEGEQMVINGLNSIPYDTEIPLGFTTGQTNSFTIKASLISNFDAGTQIMLKDYLDINNPVTTDLSDGSSYSFTSDATNNNTSRFTLMFKAPSTATGTNPENNGNVWISTRNGQIVVNGSTNRETLEVFNAVGQKVISRNLTGTNTQGNNNLPAGAYLVKLTNEGKSITIKIIID
ncbi:MAG: T9SS type A sorting domain-containing protein, partial [Paludibacter sp.]